MSSVIVRGDTAVFTTIDNIVVSTNALLELEAIPVDGEPNVYAYRVVCIPAGRDDEPTYWVDAQTYGELVTAKDVIDIYLLNRLADALG